MGRFIGIEIDSARLRVAEIEENGKKQRMLQCFSFPVPQGMVEDGEIRDTGNVADLLLDGLEAHNIRTKKVFFVAGSSRIANRRLKIPMVKKKQIQSLLEENSSEYFPIDLSKYVLSYTIMREITEPAEGNKPAVRQYVLMACAAPKSISTSCRETAELAGLTMIGIGYTGDSVYQAVKEKYASGVHLLAKIEMDHSTISIIRDGDLALQRTVSYGVDGALDAMMQASAFGEFRDEWRAYERLRSKTCINSRLEETETPPDTDPALAEARADVTESFRYLIGNISRIMDYYISRNPGVTFDSVDCCGLGAGVKGLAKLFSYELTQQVTVLDALDGYPEPKLEGKEKLHLYLALAMPSISGINLMEKLSKKEQKDRDSLSGARLIFVVGTAAGLLLLAVGLGSVIYQRAAKASLESRIASKREVQDLFDQYTAAKNKAESYDQLYAYTETPNENLRAFLEEMEQKMPSSVVLGSFSATGTDVTFQLYAADKEEAAQALIQMRTFESLDTVSTSGLEEMENGEVTMTVVCTYAEPAVLDQSSN